MEDKITILIPVYNEKDALPRVIDNLKDVLKKSGRQGDILVVDDGSTDDSAAIAESKGAKVIRHEKNLGTGAARTTGVKASENEIIVMIDGDCTYPEEAIPDMVAMMGKSDMVIGSRRAEKGTLKILRTPAKMFIKKLAEYLVNDKIPDLNSGLRVLKKSLVLKYLKYLPSTHSWVSTITLVLLSKGYKVGYFPIEYHPRVGRSTFHPLKDSYNYLSLVIRTIMYFNPLRFFLPISTFIFLAGVVKSLVDFAYTHSVQESDIIIFSTAVIVFAIGLLADLIVMMHKE
ncbi:MAG: glycosyltransferase family 2 protein [Candidatus Aureabacteria bacterium]|nr:glycosyltransferase family 2 protein [Candidatus Auribacterota bacterium]